MLGVLRVVFFNSESEGEVDVISELPNQNEARTTRKTQLLSDRQPALVQQS